MSGRVGLTVTVYFARIYTVRCPIRKWIIWHTAYSSTVHSSTVGSVKHWTLSMQYYAYYHGINFSIVWFGCYWLHVDPVYWIACDTLLRCFLSLTILQSALSVALASSERFENGKGNSLSFYIISGCNSLGYFLCGHEIELARIAVLWPCELQIYR